MDGVKLLWLILFFFSVVLNLLKTYKKRAVFLSYLLLVSKAIILRRKFKVLGL